MSRALLLLVAAGCLDPGAPGNLVPATVDEDPTLPRIEVNGTVLHAEAFGDPAAPMIVVLHGGPGGDYRAYLPYRALADDGYHVVFFDQRGSGLSRRHDAASYSMETYLDDLDAVIAHYSGGRDVPIVFLGHSWGAMYATWFLNERGDLGGRVIGAVLSEPGAFTRQGLEDYLAVQMPPWGYGSEELNDLAWGEQLLSPGDHARADFIMVHALVAGSPRQHEDPRNPAPFWRYGAVVGRRLLELGLDEGFDWTTRLGAYPHEVLFLRGELNENLPLEQQEELASHYARSRVVTIAGTGHEALWEKPDECLAHVRAYLGGLR